MRLSSRIAIAAAGAFVVLSPLLVTVAHADGCTTHDYGTDQIIATATSGNVANATATATLTSPGAVPGTPNTWNITGFEVVATGSTGALAVQVTLAGLNNGLNPQAPVTAIYPFAFPAGVTTQATSLIVTFPCPLSAAPGSAVVLTLPAGGSGNTSAAVNLHGFIQ
jgi:hypothetical protein